MSHDEQRVHVHLHFDGPINVHLHGAEQDSGTVLRKLDAIDALINYMRQNMTAQLDALKAQVERNTQIDQSIVTLVNGLAAQIIALKDDPVALQKMADDLKASNDSVAAAVVANTPVEPPA